MICRRSVFCSCCHCHLSVWVTPLCYLCDCEIRILFYLSDVWVSAGWTLLCSDLGLYIEQRRQCTYNVTLWRCYVTIVAVETKQCLLSILLSYRPLSTVQNYCCAQVCLFWIDVYGIIKKCLGLNAKCPMFLVDFNQIWSLSAGFHESLRYQIHGKPSYGSRICTCGQAGMTKQTCSFRNCLNASENYTSC